MPAYELATPIAVAAIDNQGLNADVNFYFNAAILDGDKVAYVQTPLQ